MTGQHLTQKPKPYSMFVTRRDEAIYVLMQGERLCGIELDHTTNQFTYWFVRTEQTWRWMQEYRHGKPLADLREFAKARRALSDWEYAARHHNPVDYPVGLYAASEGEVA